LNRYLLTTSSSKNQTAFGITYSCPLRFLSKGFRGNDRKKKSNTVNVTFIIDGMHTVRFPIAVRISSWRAKKGLRLEKHIIIESCHVKNNDHLFVDDSVINNWLA
jgi:hypothetical protein